MIFRILIFYSSRTITTTTSITKPFLAFKHKVKRVVCSLGVGAHLEYWGFAPDKIVELNWWEDFHPDQQVKLTATPARHFTGRGLKRAKTLWSSFVLNIHGYQLFLGGDFRLRRAV